MGLHFQSKRVSFKSGEEAYFVVDKEARYPLEYPALYLMNKLRKQGKAANTIDSVMTAIAILYSWDEESEISLHERLMKTEYLTEDEIEDLADFCLQNFKVKDDEVVTKLKVAKVVDPSLIRHSGKIKTIRTVERPSVGDDMHYQRITYIAPYLKWLSIQLAGKSAVQHRHFVQQMIDDLKDCRPRRGRNSRFKPRSITASDMEVLYSVVKHDSDDNPYQAKSKDEKKTKSIRVRNELMFTMLHKLGVRIGELLGIKLIDLHLSGTDGKIDIFRRPTDTSDTREKRAQVKTEARELPINGKLAKQVSDYVTRHRSKVKNANNCEYLFISHEKSKTAEGAPLSLAAARKVMSMLSKKTGIKVTPHNLRHTWNDEFSKHADEKRMPEETEKKLRRYLMGWSDKSNMPDHYAKRRIKEVSHQAMLEQQNKFTEGQSVE
jgi:integrase